MKLAWDETGERLYETGVKNCALFVYDNTNKQYGAGVAWNGITKYQRSLPEQKLSLFMLMTLSTLTCSQLRSLKLP